MSSRLPNASREQQTSPLLDSRDQDSATLVKTVSDGSNAFRDLLPSAPDPNSGFSVRLGSEQSPPPSEWHGYCEVSSPRSNNSNSRNVHATELKTGYQNDSAPANSGRTPAKTRPAPRPPPRSASESEVDSRSRMPVPPRTYLNNNVCSPLSRNRSSPFVTDCTNEINNNDDHSNSNGRSSRQSKPARQKLCVIMAFVAIFLAVSLAAVAAFFSVQAYLMSRDSKQVQTAEKLTEFGVTQNDSLASAHVGLMVRNLTEKEKKMSPISNYTLYLTQNRAKLHYRNVHIWDRGLTMQIRGMYFIYSSIGFNINEKFLGCDKLPHKTWLHHVMLNRADQEIPLLRSEHTCCTGCPEYHTSGFTGGVFDLLPGDLIYVRVSTPILVFDNTHSSYLGLFLVKQQ